VILDNKLSFKQHFVHIGEKVERVSRALGRLMPNLRSPIEKKRRLYAGIITSVVLYAASIWADSLVASRNYIRDVCSSDGNALSLYAFARRIDPSLLTSKHSWPDSSHTSYWRRREPGFFGAFKMLRKPVLILRNFWRMSRDPNVLLLKDNGYSLYLDLTQPEPG